MLKRTFDILMSIIGIAITLPFMLLIMALIKISSSGPIFFKQVRIGYKSEPFTIIKFRTMWVDSDKKGLLSLGNSDPRITPIGKVLRKFRLDELPQFFNILVGDMSFVGPRPEVKKYVDHYSDAQRKVLEYKPGVTDYACLLFIDIEDKLLKANEDNIDEVYIRDIMPKKIDANLNYFTKANFFSDLGIIFTTVFKTFNTNRS